MRNRRQWFCISLGLLFIAPLVFADQIFPAEADNGAKTISLSDMACGDEVVAINRGEIPPEIMAPLMKKFAAGKCEMGTVPHGRVRYNFCLAYRTDKRGRTLLNLMIFRDLKLVYEAGRKICKQPKHQRPSMSAIQKELRK